MADNIAITAGSGTNLRTKDNGSAVHVQFVALMNGGDGTTVLSNTTGIIVNGAVATDAAAAGNPVLNGGMAYAFGAHPTAMSANGDAVPLLSTRQGVLYTAQYHPDSWNFYGAYTSAQTATVAKNLSALQSTSNSWYVTDIVVAWISTGVTFKISNSNPTDLLGPISLGGANLPAFVVMSFVTPIRVGTNLSLTLTTVGASTVNINIQGFESI